MMITVRPMYPDYPHTTWRADCTVCGWKSKHHPYEAKARHAAAQHLWDKRGKVHAPPPKAIGKPAKCPTPAKKRHATQEEAKEHIASLYRIGRGNPDYRAYQCKCGAWHVGHSLKSLKRRIRLAARR